MVFEKKLIILSGERSAKGTLTLERNAYGMFATLNLYNLPDLSTGEYCAGIRSGGQFELKQLGAKGRILERFSLLLGDLSCVHCVIFDSVREIPLLYGTNTAAKLWHANQMDGFRRRVDENPTAAVPEQMPTYSGRTRDVKDYFFDILPGDRIEVPRQDEALPPPADDQAKNLSPVPPSLQPPAGQEPAKHESATQPSAPQESAARQPADSAPTQTIEQSASSLLESARNLTAQYDDGALAETNYYGGSVTYSSLEDVDPIDTLNPIDRVLGEQAPVIPTVQSVPNAASAEPASSPKSLKGNTPSQTEVASSEPSPKSLKSNAPPQGSLYTGETAFTIAPVSAYTASASASKTRPQSVFFEQIKSQMDALFAEGERFSLLENLMEDTRWVRVNYDDKRFYAVGLIGSRPDYICYAVPAQFTPTPPLELGETCRWLPENPSAPKDKGFWLMFQDATTGEAV